jgi:hypothetical protein
MGKLIRFQDDDRGCFSRVDFESGEPAFISVAQSGVLVKRSKLGLLGAKLYVASDIHDCAAISRVLDEQVLRSDSLMAVPQGLHSPVLESFTRLALESKSAADFCAAIGEARRRVLAGG